MDGMDANITITMTMTMIKVAAAAGARHFPSAALPDNGKDDHHDEHPEQAAESAGFMSRNHTRPTEVQTGFFGDPGSFPVR